jgi:hypothetical protein
MRAKGLLRIIIWTVVIVLSTMVLFVVVLRATDDGGEYRAITDKARETYQAISAPDSNAPTKSEEEFQVDATIAQQVITSPREGLDVPALQLLPGRVEDKLPVKQLSQAEESAIADAVRKFLVEWETFTPNDSKYSQRLGRVLLPGRGSDIAERRDNRQYDGVGACEDCKYGSTLQIESLDPGVYVVTHGYDGSYAYVTTQGIVQLTGNPQIPTRWRREYALILEKNNGKWFVSRAISESRGRE